MTQTVLLDNVEHADLAVASGFGEEFGDNINQVVVFPTEFGDLHREYPLFFRRDESGQFQTIALLGFDRDENLFLGSKSWQARYVPAIQQRGPFLIGYPGRRDAPAPRGEDPKILVDLDHPRIAAPNSAGERVFRDHGGHSPYLERASEALRRIHQGVALNARMFASFEAAGLLEPVAVEVKLSDSEQYDLTSFYTISEDRLAELDGDQLAELNRSGFLGLAFLVLASLGNVTRLIELKAGRGAGS